MGFRDWTLLIAAIGHLALALVSLARAGKSPLALPLALLAFDLFGWTFAVFCNHRFDSTTWRSLDVVFTSLTPAFVLHLVLVYVGKLRALRLVLRLVYAAFGALAISSSAALVSTSGSAWIESRAWAVVFLAGWIPTIAGEIWLLVRHLRAGDSDEKARTRLMLAAALVGGAFASTDLWSDLGLPLPSLAPLGTLVSTCLVAVVALRLRLFDRNLSGVTALYAGAVATAAILVYLTLFQGLRGSLPALTFGVSVVTLILTAIVREATRSFSTSRERVERLAVLGRFSAQMAHDLKNPLAALVGAVQLLDADAPREGRNNKEFHALILDQAERIRVIVETYDRLGRVEPVRTIVKVDQLVKRVTSLQEHGAKSDVKISLDLDASVPEYELDPDLVAGALENLVRNAFEAMPDGGSLVVRTRREISSAGIASVVVAVSDTGEGMDARHAERAFDDFYTTKTSGSGLGLAFVRRVALAHGGDAALQSKRGAGTTVEMRFPITT